MTDMADTKIEYEVLSRDTVKQLQDKFINGVEDKAKKAVPQDAPNPNVLVDALKTLLIACARKAIEIKVEELADVAKQGRDAVEKKTQEVDASLHNALRNIGSSYPSPKFSAEQSEVLARAAMRRHDDFKVQEVFGNEERIYLKLKASAGDISDTQRIIGHYLGDRGYKITDYAGGYATDDKGKQQFKIGKLLKEAPDMLKAFMDDSSRSLGNLVAVISRKPEDIARMSTGRAWASCMGSGGFNFEYVPKDIERGTLVAYLVSEKDPDIINPLARMLIKPFVIKHRQLGMLASFAQKVFGRDKGPMGDLFVPDKPYGIRNDEFQQAVKQFTEERLNDGKSGDFKMRSDLYQDDLHSRYTRKNGVTKPTGW